MLQLSAPRITQFQDVIAKLAQTSAGSNQRQTRGEAILVSLTRPSFSPVARAANVSGQVKVLVTVHQDGTTDAVVVDGHLMLRDAALERARSSHFECNPQ
jgi:outer membrane biosynthesis protein TonB